MHLVLAALISPQGCYESAEQHWNTAIAQSAPAQAYQPIYAEFADCAGQAIKVKAWDVYFADTVGAMYTQIQMAGLSSDKCSHYSIAADLAQQAEGVMPVPEQAVYGDMFERIQSQVKEQCGH